ncbi:MAG: transposase family protein [Spirochaetales bacterium]|nr:transposase family protein [Spirochaetales bacterium]
MDTDEIRVGTLLKRLTDNTVWRVICIINKTCRMINTESKGLEFLDMTYSDIKEALILCQMTFIEDKDSFVFDVSLLSSQKTEEFNRKRGFLRYIDANYGPTYTQLKAKVSKPEYFEALKTFGISRSSAQRLVVKWLQSGFQEISILNPKSYNASNHKPYKYKEKPGRKNCDVQGILVDDKCIEAFEYGLKLLKRQRLITIRDCFAMLSAEYYSVNEGDRIVLLPIDQRPTERQFRNYIDRILSYEDRRKIKTSNEEFRNNERVIFSTPTIEAYHPGFIVEGDALEVDLMLVSSIDQTKVVGRPILYMMIDLYSHCIVAFSVSFENNSMIGLSSLMINLFEPKAKFLEKHGVVNFNLDLWPSNFIPGEIRCDRGSDWKSKEFENVCRELGINLSYEPGATGSMKGSIEQSFRLFHQTFRTELENKGYIQKRYDSNHKETACLTIEEVIKLTTLFVAFHNGQYSKKFRLTPDMMRSRVVKTPVSIWNYGVNRFGRQITVPESKVPEVMYKLMIDDTAAITREGVHYKGLYYLPFGDKRLTERIQLAVVNAKRRNTNGELLNSLAIKKDPRLIDYLYYRTDDGKVMQLLLNNSKSGSYRGMSWNEYNEYYRYEKRMDKEGEAKSLQRIVERQQGVKNIVDSIKKVTEEPSSKNMRENRRIEKNLINTQNAIADKIPDIHPPLTENAAPELPSSKTEEPVICKKEDNKTDVPISPLLSDDVPDFFLK